jgi:signal transduction histidine kinase
MNAVKFTPRGGRVDVRLRPAADHAEIVVADTGQGIAADVLPYVFDRFRQADSSSTREHRGLGIGLALVKHLVDLHGGSVAAHSDGDGRGATFVVRLPVVAPARGASPEPPARPKMIAADGHSRTAAAWLSWTTIPTRWTWPWR